MEKRKAELLTAMRETQQGVRLVRKRPRTAAALAACMLLSEVTAHIC